jgi:hypothetical protein
MIRLAREARPGQIAIRARGLLMGAGPVVNMEVQEADKDKVMIYLRSIHISN